MPKNFVDFKAVKERVSVLQAAQWLNVAIKREGGGEQYRAPCPTCRSGGDRALAIHAGKQSFYCHAQGKGGDCIALVAHVRQISNRDAAEALQDHFLGRTEEQAPSPAPKAEPDGRRGPLQAPLDYLEHSHPVADLLGLSAATLEALGGGYAPKGTMSGRLLIPLRMDDGRLVGYLGIATSEEQEPLLRFPDNLEERCTAKPKVVAAEKPQPDQLRKLFRVVS